MGCIVSAFGGFLFSYWHQGSNACPLTVVANWNNWIPKIFYKAKLEALNHKKTFQDYMS